MWGVWRLPTTSPPLSSWSATIELHLARLRPAFSSDGPNKSGEEGAAVYLVDCPDGEG